MATVLVGGALVAPNARIASVSRLDPPSTNWFLHVSDPPDGPKRAREDDSMAKEQFYREFYRPYVEMVSGSQETVRFGGITYVFANLPGTSTRVGLDQRINQILTQSPAKRRRIEGQDEARPPDDIAEAIEGYVAQGYPQDDGNADRYVSPEGVLTEGAEEDSTQPPQSPARTRPAGPAARTPGTWPWSPGPNAATNPRSPRPPGPDDRKFQARRRQPP